MTEVCSRSVGRMMAHTSGEHLAPQPRRGFKSCLLWSAALLIALFLWLPAAPAHAHALQPAYLNLQETSPGLYTVLWKVPFAGEGNQLPLDERPEFPPDCQAIAPPTHYRQSGGILSQWAVACGNSGLHGQTLTIQGLASALNEVLVRVETTAGDRYTEILRPDHPSYTLPTQGTPPPMAWAYLRLGVQHIWTGYDHLLFVLGLVLLVTNRSALIKTITAFTVAHSITLAAAIVGWVQIPPTLVEALIALSIVCLATELVHRQQGHIGLTERYPWLVAFGFGLLHGLGFAGALREVGLPQAAVPLALLLFNLGVELGQLAFVGLLLAGLAGWRSLQSVADLALGNPLWPRLPPYAIGSVSAFLVFQRVAAFWPRGLPHP